MSTMPTTSFTQSEMAERSPQMTCFIACFEFTHLSGNPASGVAMVPRDCANKLESWFFTTAVPSAVLSNHVETFMLGWKNSLEQESLQQGIQNAKWLVFAGGELAVLEEKDAVKLSLILWTIKPLYDEFGIMQAIRDTPQGVLNLLVTNTLRTWPDAVLERLTFMGKDLRGIHWKDTAEPWSRASRCKLIRLKSDSVADVEVMEDLVGEWVEEHDSPFRH